MKPRKGHLPSIQGRFITIIVATVLPFLLLFLYWIYENSEENWQEAQSRVQLMAQLIALDPDRVGAGAPAAGHGDWSAFYHQLGHFEWPDGFTSLLLDERGTVVFQYPKSEGLTGEVVRDLDAPALNRRTPGAIALGAGTIPNRYWGLARSNQGHWAVLVGLPAAAVYADTWGDMRRNLFFIGLITLAVLGLARFWSHRITMPIRRLVQHMQGVQAGELPAHIEVASGDEMQVLAESFNIMATKIRERDAHFLPTRYSGMFFSFEECSDGPGRESVQA